MSEIRHLVDHPRIQQRTWVASGKQWLPLLSIIHAELTGKTATFSTTELTEEETTMLIKVNTNADAAYIQVRLSDIASIAVNRTRASGFVLKNGKQFITSAEEAQRIVDAMRKNDDAAGNRPEPL